MNCQPSSTSVLTKTTVLCCSINMYVAVQQSKVQMEWSYLPLKSKGEKGTRIGDGIKQIGYAHQNKKHTHRQRGMPAAGLVLRSTSPSVKRTDSIWIRGKYYIYNQQVNFSQSHNKSSRIKTEHYPWKRAHP